MIGSSPQNSRPLKTTLVLLLAGFLFLQRADCNTVIVLDTGGTHTFIHLDAEPIRLPAVTIINCTDSRRAALSDCSSKRDEEPLGHL